MNLSRRGLFGFLGAAAATPVAARLPDIEPSPTPVNAMGPSADYMAIVTTCVRAPTFVPLWHTARIVPNPH